MNSIRELMTIHGYTYQSTCHCNGYKTLKFKNGDYELRWRINKYQFRVRNLSVTIKGWSSVKMAEEYLNQLHALKETV